MNVGVPTIDVRHLVPADPIKTQWFERLVSPAAAACRFEKPPLGLILCLFRGPSDDMKAKPIHLTGAGA